MRKRWRKYKPNWTKWKSKRKKRSDRKSMSWSHGKYLHACLNMKLGFLGVVSNWRAFPGFIVAANVVKTSSILVSSCFLWLKRLHVWICQSNMHMVVPGFRLRKREKCSVFFFSERNVQNVCMPVWNYSSVTWLERTGCRRDELILSDCRNVE